MTRRSYLWLLLAACLIVGCREDAQPQPTPPAQARTRRPPPPTGVVRALPPHAILSDGVGPYRLGGSLASELADLPSGPRMTTLDIPTVVRANLIRAEQGGVLIGGPPLGKATFVAVVAAELAKTDAGIAVGSKRADVVKVLPLAPVSRTWPRDSKLATPVGRPEFRLLFDSSETLRALVVQTSPPPQPMPHLCKQDNQTDGVAVCFSAAGETVRSDGEELSVFASDGKLIATQRFRGLLWFGPLADGDRDVLATVSLNEVTGAKQWVASVWRVETGKFVRIGETVSYRVNDENARWIGSELRNIDVAIDFLPTEEGAMVSGYIMTFESGRMRDVAPLIAKPLEWKKMVERPVGEGSGEDVGKKPT